jgi:replication fork protection complex subunit Tof1/Swi1
LFSFSS